MARLARVFAVDVPHHVAQRGNRWMQAFFNVEIRLMRQHERTVRPMGDPGIIASLEKSLHRPLHAKITGPKKGVKSGVPRIPNSQASHPATALIRRRGN